MNTQPGKTILGVSEGKSFSVSYHTGSAFFFLGLYLQQLTGQTPFAQHFGRNEINQTCYLSHSLPQSAHSCTVRFIEQFQILWLFMTHRHVVFRWQDERWLSCGTSELVKVANTPGRWLHCLHLVTVKRVHAFSHFCHHSSLLGSILPLLKQIFPVALVASLLGPTLGPAGTSMGQSWPLLRDQES